MRYDTPIYFQTIKKGEYDPDTGNYAEDTVTEDKVFASVTDSRAETLNLVYGELKQGCYTVRLQNIYKKPFAYIRIGEKRYRVDFSRKLKLKHIFVISEVQ